MITMKDLRKGKGLTQKGLAELVGTSQQQIQRLESGATMAPTATLATAICRVLGCSLEDLFLNSRHKMVGRDVLAAASEPEREKILQDSANTGIELDDRPWAIRLLLKGRLEPVVLPLEASEKRRLDFCLKSELPADAVAFIGIESGYETYMINRLCILHAEFIVEQVNDPGITKFPAEEVVMRLDFVDGNSKCVSFPPCQYEGWEHDGSTPVGAMFERLSSGRAKRGSFERLVDMNGGEHYLQPESIVSIRVPTNVFIPFDEDVEEEVGIAVQI